MSHPAGQPPKPKSLLLQATEFSYLGIFFGVAICVGYFGGAYFDRRLGWSGRLSVVGVLLGIAAGFRELWRMAARYQRTLRRQAQGAGGAQGDEEGGERFGGAAGGRPPGVD